MIDLTSVPPVPLSRKIIFAIVTIFPVYIAVSVIFQNRFPERDMLEKAQLAAHAYADIVKEFLVSVIQNLSKVS